MTFKIEVAAYYDFYGFVQVAATLRGIVLKIIDAQI